MKNLKITIVILICLNVYLLNSCKKVDKIELLFSIKNKVVLIRDKIEIDIFNKSNKDYFIIMDTVNYYDLNQNFDLNNIIRPNQVFYMNQVSIEMEVYSKTCKQYKLDTFTINCNEIKRKQSQEFVKKLKNLENIIVLKKKSITSFSIPFSTNYSICDKEFNYEIKKNKSYQIQLNYQLKKNVLLNLVSKEKIEVLKKNNLFPFYGNLISNKVSIKFVD